MFSQRPNVVNFLLLLLVVNFVFASQGSSEQSPQKDGKAKILASNNVNVGPETQNNLKALLAKSLIPSKLLGPDSDSGELKSLSSGGSSEPSIQSKNLEGLSEFDSPIYNGFKKLFYTSFCRPLGLTQPADLDQVRQLDKQDGAAPKAEVLFGNGYCVRRESISSLFTDELCNNYLEEQVEFINEHKRMRREDWEEKKTIKDDLSVSQKAHSKNKNKIETKLTFHSGLGLYFDGVCNMYVHKDDPEEFYKGVAVLISRARSPKNHSQRSKVSPAGTTVWKVPDTDIWVDQDTCDLLNDRETELFKETSTGNLQKKNLRALLGI